MNRINYAEMSDEELRQYFLENRDDQAAMEAFFDRLKANPDRVITTVDDPDFSAKIEASIQLQLQEVRNNG
jgi:hypothetical protein